MDKLIEMIKHHEGWYHTHTKIAGDISPSAWGV